jgi:hypothetical protein
MRRPVAVLGRRQGPACRRDAVWRGPCGF